MSKSSVIKRGAALFSKTLDRLLVILSIIAGLLLVFITFSIGYSILARLLNLPSFIWVVQINEYAMLWLTFLATAWLLKSEQHVYLDIVTRFLSYKAKASMRCFHSLLGMGLCFTFAWFGTKTVIDQLQRGTIDVKSIDVPMYIVTIIIPLGFILLFLQFFRNLYRAAGELRKDI